MPDPIDDLLRGALAAPQPQLSGPVGPAVRRRVSRPLSRSQRRRLIAYCVAAAGVSAAVMLSLAVPWPVVAASVTVPLGSLLAFVATRRPARPL